MNDNHWPADRAVTLTELLVVISIIVVLISIFLPALAAFSHTSRVDAAADTVVSVLREARSYAMTRNVHVAPVILRDKNGKFTITYGHRALGIRLPNWGNNQTPFHWSTKPPFTLSSPSTFSGGGYGCDLYRAKADLPTLVKGAFVYFPVSGPYWMGCDPIQQAGCPLNAELMYIQATPPSSLVLANNPTQYTYTVQMRGVHNTARVDLSWFSQRLASSAWEGYIIDGQSISATDLSGPLKDNWSGKDYENSPQTNYTISGFTLPEYVCVDTYPLSNVGPNAWNDTWTDPLDSGGQHTGRKGPIYIIRSAQDGIFYEQGLLQSNSGNHYPDSPSATWQPIFTPEGTARFISSEASYLGGYDGACVDQTLRVFDAQTREARFVVVRAATGQVFIKRVLKLPRQYSQVYPPPAPPPLPATSSNGSSGSSSSSSGSSSSGSSSSGSSGSSGSSSSSSGSSGGDGGGGGGDGSSSSGSSGSSGSSSSGNSGGSPNGDGY